MSRARTHAVRAGLAGAFLLVALLGHAAEGGTGPAPPRPVAAASDASRLATADIRVLLLGDSLVNTEFGLIFQQVLNATPGLTCQRRARSATGLSRSDAFDWVDAGLRAVTRHRPELVIVMIGSNDGQDVVPPPKDRLRGQPPFPRVNWERPDWGAAYQGRVSALLGHLGAPERQVLWLELPPVRSLTLERKLRRIREAQRAAVLARPAHADYLSVVRLLTGSGPRHLSARQRWTRFRPDGVHFSLRGARRLSGMLLPVVFAMAPRVYAARFTRAHLAGGR